MRASTEHLRRAAAGRVLGRPSVWRRPRWLAAAAALGMMVGTPALTAIASPAGAAAPHGDALTSVAARPVLPAGARALGAVPAARVITGVVALKTRNAAALGAFATAVSTPSSAQYHQYLTPSQFAARFGPAPASTASVVHQLRRSGLTVTSVSGNGLLVDFKGRASTTGAAFHTSIGDYRLASGRVAFAPTSAVLLPSSVAGIVQSVVGLDDLAVPQPLGASRVEVGDSTSHPRATAPASSAVATAGGPSACPAATAAATEYGGLTDTQIANAYGVNGLYAAGDTGAGQTVAIFELEPYRTADIQAFDTCFFGAAKAATMLHNLTDVPVDGGPQVGPGSGEAELDIDDVSAVAPGAKIDVYSAPNTDVAVLDDYNAIVTQDAAKVVSSSWGDCESFVQATIPGSLAAENSIFEEAAAQGQSVFAAAGDSGEDDCSEDAPVPTAPILSVDDPASQPYVTSVGGTTITDATNPPKEQVWNDGNNWGAGGGGISSTWRAPSWQAHSRAPGLFNHAIVTAAQQAAVALGQSEYFCGTTSVATCREVPDVSAQADEFTGAVTVYLDGQWETIGGTSSSTPLWAAMIADTNATRACSLSGGVGFVSPSLYTVASVPSEYAASFNDVTVGNNDDLGVTGGLYPATRGYDMASGLGSPRVTGPGGARGLAYYLCSTPGSVSPHVTGVSPAAVSATTSAPLTITGSGFEIGSAPDVAGVQIGNVDVPTSDINVLSATELRVPSPLGSAEVSDGVGTGGSGAYTVAVTLTDGATSVPSVHSRVALFAPATVSTALPVVDAVGPSGGNEAASTPVVIYGSGFTGATAVTFGGVAGTVARVVSDDQLDATAPDYSGSTTCHSGDQPTTDVCQSEVRVTTPHGTSLTAAILPEATVPEPTPQPGAEGLPAATEFDYLPTPTITGLSETAGPPDLATEAGGTSVTITGKGLGQLGLMWINVGPPTLATSEDIDYVSLSGTSDTFLLPAIPPTPTVTSRRVTVQTLASANITDIAGSAPSNVVLAYYAPVPTVATATTANGRGDGPSSGGTTLTINGSGFDGAQYILLTDTGNAEDFSSATDYNFLLVSDDRIVLSTPGANPGVDQVEVCGVSGCSTSSTATFTYYPLGNPTVASIAPKTGPAGTKVTITGKNLGFVRAVWFGLVQAKVFANGPGLLDSGNTNLVTAVVPKGIAGGKVNVRIATLESRSTEVFPKSPVNPAVTFTYHK